MTKKLFHVLTFVACLCMLSMEAKAKDDVVGKCLSKMVWDNNAAQKACRKICLPAPFTGQWWNGRDDPTVDPKKCPVVCQCKNLFKSTILKAPFKKTKPVAPANCTNAALGACTAGACIGMGFPIGCAFINDYLLGAYCSCLNGAMSKCEPWIDEMVGNDPKMRSVLGWKAGNHTLCKTPAAKEEVKKLEREIAKAKKMKK